MGCLVAAPVVLLVVLGVALLLLTLSGVLGVIVAVFVLAYLASVAWRAQATHVKPATIVKADILLLGAVTRRR